MATLEQERMTELLKGKQVRYLKPELRAEEVDGKKYLRGYALLFNTPTTPYRGYDEYKEEILPEALDGLEMSDMRVLINHNPDLLLGRVGKNARVERDGTGLFTEVEIHSGVQYAKDYYNMVKAGILDGMSFAFMVDKDDISYDRDKDVYQIRRISDMWEVSFVTFPAYEETVAIAREQQKPVVDLESEAEAEPEQRTEETTPESEPVMTLEVEATIDVTVPSPDAEVDAQKRAALYEELDRLLGGNNTDAKSA